MPPRRLAVLLSILGYGCATGLSLPTALVVDDQGNPGGEGTVRATALLGGPNPTSALASLGVGGGWIRDAGSYLLVVPAIGVEGGQRLRARGSLFSSIRSFEVGSGSTRGSVGVELMTLFGIADTGGEDGKIQIGPRFAAEILPERASIPLAAIFSIGVAIEWISFDTRHPPTW
jgi:hypothetical protein